MHQTTENTTKRIFIGTFVQTHSFVHSVNELKKAFTPSVNARWVKTQNLHITAYFYGNATWGEIEQIHHSLTGILNKPINKKITLNGLGVFYKKQKPYILYVKPESEENILLRSISYIHKQLYEQRLINFLPHNYTPHITLARIKQINNNFTTVLNQYKNTCFGIVPSIKYQIIESILTPSGPVYKPLEL